MSIDNEFIYGRNAVIEALKSDTPINKILLVNENGGSIGVIKTLAREKGIIFSITTKEKLTTLTGTSNHQGVMAYLSARQYDTLEDILEHAKDKGQDPFIVVLDEIQDPHNLGAIIRSADAAGAHGIIISKRRQVPLTAAVAKSSAGAIEHMKIARVSNIAQTLDKLKNEGIWIVGTDADGEFGLFNCDLKGPVAIVVGSEGKGMGSLVKKKCDLVLSIPMVGKITSLNASVAASLVMYEVLRQRSL